MSLPKEKKNKRKKETPQHVITSIAKAIRNDPALVENRAGRDGYPGWRGRVNISL